jgi:hypothetical protein
VCSRLVSHGSGAASLHMSVAGEGSWAKEEHCDEAPEVPAFWKGATTSRRRWHLNTVPRKTSHIDVTLGLLPVSWR